MTTLAISESAVGHPQMTELCDSFPVLHNKPGTNPWNQCEFAAWASRPGPTHASRQAAAFVLSVWNGSCEVRRDQPWFNKKPYRVGRFDVVEAFGVWDYQQKEAFLAWCCNPFFP